MSAMDTKKCEICGHSRAAHVDGGHSRAAHVDGVHCALCRCNSQRTVAVQESLNFRNSIPIRTAAMGRKR